MLCIYFKQHLHKLILSTRHKETITSVNFTNLFFSFSYFSWFFVSLSNRSWLRKTSGFKTTCIIFYLANKLNVTQAFLLFSYVSLCHKTAEPAFIALFNENMLWCNILNPDFSIKIVLFLSINFNNRKGEIIILIDRHIKWFSWLKHYCSQEEKFIKLTIIIKSALSILYEIYPSRYLMGCCECIISSYHFTDFLELEEKNTSLLVWE